MTFFTNKMLFDRFFPLALEVYLEKFLRSVPKSSCAARSSGLVGRVVSKKCHSNI